MAKNSDKTSLQVVCTFLDQWVPKLREKMVQGLIPLEDVQSFIRDGLTAQSQIKSVVTDRTKATSKLIKDELLIDVPACSETTLGECKTLFNILYESGDNMLHGPSVDEALQAVPAGKMEIYRNGGRSMTPKSAAAAFLGLSTIEQSYVVEQSLINHHRALGLHHVEWLLNQEPFNLTDNGEVFFMVQVNNRYVTYLQLWNDDKLKARFKRSDRERLICPGNQICFFKPLEI